MIIIYLIVAYICYRVIKSAWVSLWSSFTDEEKEDIIKRCQNTKL